MTKSAIILLIFFTTASCGVFGQSALEARFGSASIEAAEGTEKLAILEFQNLHGYVVQDLSGIKDVSQYPDALDVEVILPGAPALTDAIENGSFELFAYDFPLGSKTNQYYRVRNSGKILVIYPITTVKELYSEQ